MAAINEEARIPVYINDEQAKSALKNLQNEAEKWRKKMYEAMTAGDMKGVKEVERELGKVNKQMNALKKEAFDVNKVLSNLSIASEADMNKALQSIRTQMKGLNRDSKEYIALNNQRAAIRDEFRRINGTLVEQEGILGRIKKILPFATFGAIAAGAKQLWDNIRSVRQEYEKYEAVLKVSLGSQRAARKELNMLSDFAATTPYQLSELTESFVKLTNYGLKPSRDEMRKYGDIAASVGKSFDQWAEAVADAITGENERLKEFGIRASKHGDTISYTFRGITTEVDNNAEAIKNYLVSLGDVQGVSGSMAAISKTMEGATSNMADSFDRLFNKWGSGALGKYFVTQVQNITDFVSKLAGTTPTLQQELEGVRVELDKELTVLRLGNFTAEERANTIRQINTEYKDYLPNLLDEKSSLEDIEKFQNLINQHLQARVIYAAYEEEIKDLLEQQKSALEGQYGIEKQRTEMRLGMTPELGAQGTQIWNNILDMSEQMNQSVIENTDKNTAEVKKKYESMAQSIGLTFEGIQKIVNGGNSSGGSSTTTVDPKEAQKALTTAFKEEQNILKQQYADKELSQQRYNDEMYALELAHLYAMRELYKEHSAEFVDIEGQIIDKKIAWQQTMDELMQTSEQISQQLSEADQKMFADIESAMDKELDTYINSLNKETEATIIAEEKKRQAREQAKEAAIQNSYEQAAAAVDGAESIADAGKAVLNSIREQIKGYLAQAVAAQVANVIKTVPFPFNIAIAAAAGGALSLLFNKIVPKFATGGFTQGATTYVAGEAGQEWIAPNWMLKDQNAKQLIDVLELARQNGSLARLDLRPVVASVASNQQGYAGGGSTSAASGSSTTTIVQQAVDPEMKQLITELRDQLKNGIGIQLSSGSNKSAKSLAEGFSELNRISQNIGK